MLLLPLLVAIFAIATKRDFANAKYIAFAGSILSLLLFPAIDSGVNSTNWFTINGTTITITTSVTPLSSLLLLLVLLIGPLIFVYSFGFMTLPSEQRRYYMEMLAFEAAMLSFAMAGDFILLFIAWEFLSLTSYLLIGFWHGRERALAAARKTITIILIGDIALLAAIVIFQNAFGTLVFNSIISNIASVGISKIAVVFLLIAIISKSAQFPLQEWLPDAMEGPTPVSAFLHSTTMVKAGVFLALVLFPLLYAANMLLPLLAIGAVTIAVSVYGALRETHIKRVLAYSTVQELGLMLVAIASNALLAAIYFFLAQSFYKALLFFSSGAAMKANDSENLNEISGIKRNKIVYFTTLFGILSLAGFIPFDGFFANLGIGSAFSTNLIAYVLISFMGLATSFYIFRWFFMQDKKTTNKKVSLTYDSIPNSMTYPMVVLAVACLAVSVIFFSLTNMFANSIATGLPLGINTLEIGVESIAAVIGAAVGYYMYKSRKKKLLASVKIGPLTNKVYSAVFLNATYNHVAEFVGVLGTGFAYFDLKLNELYDFTGHVVIRFSGVTSRLATGSINLYIALFAAGVLVLLLAVAAI